MCSTVVTFSCVTWLPQLRDMTHSYAWDLNYSTFVCKRSYGCHGSYICKTCLIHMCDMTHSYVWHDSFIFVTWPIHMCDMTHSYLWHDPFIRARLDVLNLCTKGIIYVTWLIHLRDMNYSSAWHEMLNLCSKESESATWLIICVPCFVHVWDMPNSFERHDVFQRVTWNAQS